MHGEIERERDEEASEDEDGDGDEGLEKAEEGDAEEAEEEAAEAGLDHLLREQFEGAEVLEQEGAKEGPAAGALEEAQPRPRGADEFVCQSCFLVKHRRQLADPVRLICRDCADPG